jgi:MFS-type transporter involved in bile tolerance (Atg22 family)
VTRSAASLRSDLGEGGRYVLRHAHLRPLLAAHALANLELGLVWAIVVVYAVSTLGLTAALVGIALSLGQIGGLIGAIFGQRIAQRVGVGRMVVAAFFLFAPAALLLCTASAQRAFARRSSRSACRRGSWASPRTPEPVRFRSEPQTAAGSPERSAFATRC